MLMLISPAKSLDYQRPLPTTAHTLPRLLEHSSQLIDVCRTLSVAEIEKLMSVSEKIATLNAQRFQDWHADLQLDEQTRQAIFAFDGDVYTGLNAYQFNDSQLEFAQQHLRILSGLYGVLRPLDLMLAYRLEMGTKLKTAFGQNLYDFWQNKITDVIQQDLNALNTDLVINLASDEYYKAVKPKKLTATILKITFLDQKHGQYKIISFYAKKARGLMARFIIEQQISNIEQLKAFDLDGYYFDTINSTAQELVFKRDEIMD